MTRRLLAAGIRVPRYLAISEKAWQEQREEMEKKIEETLGYPCVVKPTRERCSIGLSVVREGEELVPAMENAFHWDTICVVDEPHGPDHQSDRVILGSP